MSVIYISIDFILGKSWWFGKTRLIKHKLWSVGLLLGAWSLLLISCRAGLGPKCEARAGLYLDLENQRLWLRTLEYSFNWNCLFLCFRSLNGWWKSTGWLIACSQSTWPWTVLTPCSVRPTTTCLLHTAASRCMSSGNSTMTSYQTTVTMVPPTGWWI